MENDTFLTEAVQQEMEYYHIPGCAVAVIDKGEVSFFHFGWSDIKKQKRFTEHTVSGIGSCTKSMTVMAAMRLADQGCLSLDRPVADYLPGCKLWDDTASRAVTLRDMLCHRPGVAGPAGDWTDGIITRVDYLRRLRSLAPNASLRPGGQVTHGL